MTNTSFPSTKDTYINGMDPYKTDNYGTGIHIRVGHTVDATKGRGLIEFADLGLTIPPGDNLIINSATLHLFVSANAAANNRVLSCYRMKTAWYEVEATWVKRMTSAYWTADGAMDQADRELTAMGSVQVYASYAVGQAVDVSLNPALLREWVMGTTSNYGLLLIVDTESNDRYSFATKEHTTASYRPTLEIDWTLSGVDQAIWIY